MSAGFFAPSEVHKERPVGLVPKCGACGLYRTCSSPKMRVYGKGKLGVLVVGEAPGQTEDEEGRPFIGRAGQYLREILDEIDISLDRDAWTTNALICRPPNNATPDAKQISYCRPNLLNTLRDLQPNVVLLLGRSAVASFMVQHWKEDIGPLERWVGWKIPTSEYWICPTYHPSHLLRSKNQLMDNLFASHLKQAFEIDERPPKQDSHKANVQILFDGDEIENAVRRIEHKAGWVAIDYEANCLKPDYPKAKLASCALSNGEDTISFPWTEAAVEAIRRFALNKEVRKIAANLKYEERWTLRTYGHGMRNWGWDTMLATHCLDNRHGICSLKFQSLVTLGVDTYNAHVESYLSSGKGHYNRIAELDINDLLFYGGFDALFEYKLAMHQRKLMGYAS